MKTIRTVAPTATITKKVHDWTRLLIQNAPAATLITDFRVEGVSCDGVAAKITYGRHGTVELTFYRFRESSDDPGEGHRLYCTLPSGKQVIFASERLHGDDDDDSEDDEDVRTGWRTPSALPLGSLTLDAHQLFDLMERVHDRLVPTRLIAS